MIEIGSIDNCRDERWQRVVRCSVNLGEFVHGDCHRCTNTWMTRELERPSQNPDDHCMYINMH